MKLYETLVLAIPEITADESTELEKQFNSIVKQAQGSLRLFERWGKYKLEFPIWHNEYGVYYLTRFEVPSDKANEVVKEIDNLFRVKLPSLIMRHITTALRIDHPMSYIKPESLEDMPSQDVETFIKDKNQRYDRSREHVKEDEEAIGMQEG